MALPLLALAGIAGGASLLGGALEAAGAAQDRVARQTVQLSPEDQKNLERALASLRQSIPQFGRRLEPARQSLLEQLQSQAPNLQAPSLDPLTQLILSQGAQRAAQRAAGARRQAQRSLGVRSPGVAQALANQAAIQQAAQVNALLLPALQQQLQNRLAQAQVQQQQERQRMAAAQFLAQLAGQELKAQQSEFLPALQLAQLRAGREQVIPGTPFLQTLGARLAGAGAGALTAALLGGGK